MGLPFRNGARHQGPALLLHVFDGNRVRDINCRGFMSLPSSDKYFKATAMQPPWQYVQHRSRCKLKVVLTDFVEDLIRTRHWNDCANRNEWGSNEPLGKVFGAQVCDAVIAEVVGRILPTMYK